MLCEAACFVKPQTHGTDSLSYADGHGPDTPHTSMFLYQTNLLVCSLSLAEESETSSSPAEGQLSPSRSYRDSSSSSSNSNSPATTTPTAAAAAAVVVAVFDPLPPITGELLLFLEKYRGPDTNRPADGRQEEAGDCLLYTSDAADE